MHPPTTIDLQGQSYQIGRLNPLTQFHVSRRLGPIVASMGGEALRMAVDKKTLGLDDWLAFLGPISEVLAKMSDEDVNYIIGVCMSVIQRRQGEKWARIQINGQLIFEDIDMMMMLRLTSEVIKENLGGFFVPLREGAQS